MKKRILIILTVLLFVFGFATNLQAIPVQWSVEDGGNGHFYEPVSIEQPIEWMQARDAAVTAGGYLCTITSEIENEFVFDLVSDLPEMWTYDNGDMGPWLGGFQIEGSIEPSSGWLWVTGEPFVYTNWAANQPDNMANAEHWLHFYSMQHPKQWNDAGYPGDPVYSYIVEYIPEPATIILLTLGGLVLRKRK